MTKLLRPSAAAAVLAALSACARPAPLPEPAAPAAAPAPAAVAQTAPAPVDSARPQPPRTKSRIAPPQVAAQLGLMGLSSTGVTGFRLEHPRYDGRGVLIAILDGGVDPGIQGLTTLSTGGRKILDIRDFSGEGRIALQPGGEPGLWTGTVREILFGELPQADLNGDGDNRDTFAVEVRRDSVGWEARLDLDGDGSFDDEAWMRDYLVAHETFTFASRWVARGHGPITGALNIGEEDARPVLTLVLDTSGHGSHVAGIAAGNDIYGTPGFDGVAPGAWLLALKFADNRRGSVTTNTSMLRALEYAARFAAERHLPLVVNMSFGVGNARMGRAVSDSVVDAFLIAHPEVLFVVAAGNEGPGTSTTGQPGSAELALTVGALYPRALAAVEFDNPTDAMGWWSSRGGALAKPDIVAPGVMYSTVPAWDTGNEVAGGTSMAAPHAAGLTALLWSAALAESLQVTPAQIVQALRSTASHALGVPFVDQGYGTPRISEAWDFLRRRPAVTRVRVEALPARLPSGVPARTGDVAGASRERRPTAAYRREALAPGDTTQRYRVSILPDTRPGAPAPTLTYALVSDAPWLHPAQPTVTLDARTGSAVIELRMDPAQLNRPGRYSGVVYGTSASDPAAGPAFALVSTVLVPETSARVAVTGRRLAAGSADRFYIRVPDGAAGLAMSATIADTSMRGSVDLFEPTDRPARGAKSSAFGGADGRRPAAAVPAQDMPSGVWEAVVQAYPGADVAYDLTLRPSPVRIAAMDTASSAPVITLTGEPGTDTMLQAQVDLVGVAQDRAVDVQNGAITSWTVPVPAWAKRVRVEAEVTPVEFEQVTDFAITVYDATGARIGVEAMSYPYDRLQADLPEHRADGYTATVELFPAFAAPPPASYPMRVRVRFEGDPRPALAAVPVRFPAGATLNVPAVSGLDVPEGWRYLLALRLAADEADRTPTTRLFTVPVTR